MIISSKVVSEYRKCTILEYLSRRFTYFSADKWCSCIISGLIYINDQIITLPHQKIFLNDIIGYDMPDFVEPYADLNYSIIYEDKWLLGINKPGNLLVHKSGKSFKNNLIYQLRHVHKPKFETADIIQRIDRETSGVVLVSKRKDIVAMMHSLILKAGLKKIYYAVVHGVPSEDEGIINLPIEKDTSSSIRYKFRVTSEGKGKNAETKYKVEHTFKGGLFSLLRCEPLSGRTHQIRVHLLALGYPIVGDKLYSQSEASYLTWRSTSEKGSGLLLERQALHCSRLSFVHPITNKLVYIKSPFPDDIATF